MDRDQSRRERLLGIGFDLSAGDKQQTLTGHVDDAPGGAAEARVDAKDANRGLRHESGDSLSAPPRLAGAQALMRDSSASDTSKLA